VALARRTKKETVQELTEGENLQVVRIAQGGDIRGAIAHYLQLAIGEERANQYENPTDMLGDPALSVVFDDRQGLWRPPRRHHLKMLDKVPNPLNMPIVRVLNFSALF
jgi:hypothetical protein